MKYIFFYVFKVNKEEKNKEHLVKKTIFKALNKENNMLHI